MAYIKQDWFNGETIATAERMKHIEDGIADLYNAIFPIGQIVIKGDNEDYSNWLGFTWERTAVGKVLVGIDSTDTDFNEIGKTSGEKKVTLTVAQMPKHSHEVKYGTTANLGLNSGTTGYKLNYENGGAQQLNAITAGGGEAHNNSHTYQVVAHWNRIA